MRRRRFLAATGAAFTVAGAGCLGGPGGDEPTTDPEPGTDGTTTEPPTTAPATTHTTDERTTEPAAPSAEAIQFGVLNQPTGWDEERATGRVVVIDSVERARAALPHDRLGQDRATTVWAFVEDTDFGRSTLLFVQSAGPNACYGELAVDDIGVEAGEIRGTATAVDGSDGGMCADVLTFPGALVRVTAPNGPPTAATLTVTDGWEESAEISASDDDPLGPALADLAGAVRPDGDPPAVPEPLSCDSAGFTRHGNWVEDPPRGEYEHEGEPAFALRVSETDLSYGDTVTVTLTNVSDQSLSTGNRHKYSLQVQTEDGWQDVRGSTEQERFAYTDEAVMHRPGEGFEWTFELTEPGLVADHTHDLTVCPDLQTGRYRFVYFSPGVAVSFDLQR